MEVDAIAERLLRSLDSGAMCEPISDESPDFSVDDAYAVLAAIGRRREASGWRRAGRKIGFTNRTLWEAFGVDRAFWADVWDSTVVPVSDGAASVALGSLAQPRIEPEVVFGLAVPCPRRTTRSQFWRPSNGWRPASRSCSAPIRAGGSASPTASPRWGSTARSPSAHPCGSTTRTVTLSLSTLAQFEATLWRDGDLVDRGAGANVMDSPALALGHLARVISEQPGAPALGAGESSPPAPSPTCTPCAPASSGERTTARSASSRSR